MKSLVIFQNFKAPKASLKNYTFLLTNSVFIKLKKFQRFRAQIDSCNFSAFSQTVFVFEENWKISNFQSSNSLLKNTILSANQLREWYNLNYLRFRAWLDCVKKSKIPRTDSLFEITCYISKFQRSKS